MTAHSSRDKRMRQRIAMEAARLMAEHGISDYYAAKRKAAHQLGASDTHNMPRNEEVEQALGTYQRLFQAELQPRQLRALRTAAVQAMRLLEPFQPRLVGSVLSGTAHAHSDVNLHLFTDVPEEVGVSLLQHEIPHETHARQMRWGSEEMPLRVPAYRFVAGEMVIDLTVFAVSGLRQAPRSPVDGRPMRRLALEGLLSLLEEES